MTPGTPPLPSLHEPAFHAALLDAVGESVILTDLEGRILGWNAGATRVFGYAAEEMLGLTPAVLYPDEAPDRLVQDLERILAGEDFRGEWRGRRRDGATVWVEVRTTLVRNAAGQPVGFLGVARDISDRKHAEAALAQGQARLELIADTAPVYIVQCDLERRFRFVNRAYAERFGLTPEQVAGRYIWEVVGAEAYESLRHHVDQALAGQRVEFEMEIPYQGLGRQYIHCSYAPLLGVDRSVQGAVAVITDIGQRKRAETALREQEALLRTVLEALPVGVWVLDEDATLTYANPATHRIWGGAPLVPSAQWGVFKAWWPDGRPLRPEENPVMDVLRDGVVRLNDEWDIETFDGVRKSILASSVPLRSPAGEIVGAIAINVDVTEHRRAEAALRESETRLKLAQAAAELAIWEWDPVTGVTSYTPEFYPLYGLPPDAPPPSFEEWQCLVHPDDRERVAADVRDALAGSKLYETEFRVVWPDGSVRWVAGRGQVLRDPAGRPTKMMGINFDVTRRREAELKLRQLDRMEAVARLAGGVAHETNNQMAVVLGAASFILRRTDLLEPVRRDVVYIQEAAERTAAITRQLLAFSRRQLMQARVLDLNAAIVAFETILRRTAGEDVELRLALAPEPMRVRIDEGQLQQVLLNLTLNARDAMPRGGTLVLETREVVTPEPEGRGRLVELCVRDTGIGMDAQTLAHMFEPFFTTKGVGSGTGLGLASVYGIVKQSNGEVFAESAPDRGTSLRILLPLETGPLTPESAERPAPEGGRETVLVVEDEPGVRTMMVRSLREAGYTVLEAGNAGEALALAGGHEGPVHLLISDLAMPGMRGRELADALTRLRPGVRVLFVSGFPGDEVARLGLLETGRPFLPKPFDPEALAAAVRGLLDATPP